MENRFDIETVSFAANWYINQFGKDNVIFSSTTENFKLDFEVENGNEKKYVEVKSFISNLPFNEWKRKDNTGYCFKFAPAKTSSIVQLKNMGFVKPTQEQLNEYMYKEDGTELSKNYRLYALNAASGRYFTISNDKQYQPKWYKIYNSNSELIILFKDGILHFAHEQLINAFVGYGFKYSKQYQISPDSDSYWQMKAFIELDKGTFYKLDIPDILKNKK